MEPDFEKKLFVSHNVVNIIFEDFWLDRGHDNGQ
jgi:hypothetical protein